MSARKLALLIAAAVIAGSPTAPPSFSRNFDEAEPETTKRFIGATWPCGGKYADETCFAGLRLPSLLPHTGP